MANEAALKGSNVNVGVGEDCACANEWWKYFSDKKYFKIISSRQSFCQDNLWSDNENNEVEQTL